MFIRILAPALLAFGLLAAATLTKRDDTDVQSIFTTLKAQTDVILPQFGTLVGNNTATDATVGPLVSQLTTAIRNAKISLELIPPEKRRLARRQTDQDVANMAGGIVSDVAQGFAPLQTSATDIPSFHLFSTEVDTSLEEILLGLNDAIDGILTLVSAAVDFVVSILDNLGFAQVLSILGL